MQLTSNLLNITAVNEINRTFFVITLRHAACKSPQMPHLVTYAIQIARESVSVDMERTQIFFFIRLLFLPVTDSF